MAAVTEREEEILDLVKEGINSPSELASKLGISESGASQALQKLAEKGKLVRKKSGKEVHYEELANNHDSDLYFLAQAYNHLSQVWAFISVKNLSKEDLNKAREARDTLEEILAKKSEKRK